MAGAGFQNIFDNCFQVEVLLTCACDLETQSLMEDNDGGLKLGPTGTLKTVCLGLTEVRLGFGEGGSPVVGFAITQNLNFPSSCSAENI